MPMFGTLLTGSTGVTPRLQLEQYCASCKYCLVSDFSTWDLINLVRQWIFTEQFICPDKLDITSQNDYQVTEQKNHQIRIPL